MLDKHVRKRLDANFSKAYKDSMEPIDTIDNHILDFASCYRALSARDARFDGVFFTGVKSTGVYCRPVCSAKTPLAKSCTFFATAANAEQAGFRPCLRCRPELAPYAIQQNLAYAIWQRIVAGALNEGKLDTLAQQVGLSTRQLRRVLQQHFGVSPVELAQPQRLLFAKKLLQETALPMTDIAFAAGFHSIRRFNALFVLRYGMAPTALRNSQRVNHSGLKLRLAYRPPLDWERMLHYLAPRSLGGVEWIDFKHMAYVRTLRLASQDGWLRVTQDARKHQLCIELPLHCTSGLMPLLAQLRQLFDLDANPGVIEQHLHADQLLANHLHAHPGLRVPGTLDRFELGMRTILGQQVSVAGASTLTARLIQRFGSPCSTPWPELSHHFPLPQHIANLSAADLATIGVPHTRAETLRHFAQFAERGGLDFAPGASLELVLAQLQQVPGIGAWSAHYIALRALRFPDAFPAGDLGLQKAAAWPAPKFSEKALHARAQAWSPWRAYAAMALWQGANAPSDGSSD